MSKGAPAKFPKAARVRLKNGHEAIVLENELEHCDYFVAYKRSGGSWSQMNCEEAQVEGLWVDLVKVEFKCNITSVTKDSVTFEVHNKDTLKLLEEQLSGKRVHVVVNERK